jgi:hypothetical protein
MSLEKLKQNLQQQYQVINFVDLLEYDHLPKGRLYTALRKLHKKEFNNNERIIFIASDSLKKSFADQPHDIITILQQYIQHHDIPHFFVIVLSNIKSIAQDLMYVQRLYNTQEVNPIECIYYDQ